MNNKLFDSGNCMKECPPTYTECKPIESCSKQIVNQYHITKQPYVHTFVTEVVHHHVTQNEFIPKYVTCERHVNEPTQNCCGNNNGR